MFVLLNKTFKNIKTKDRELNCYKGNITLHIMYLFGGKITYVEKCICDEVLVFYLYNVHSIAQYSCLFYFLFCKHIIMKFVFYVFIHESVERLNLVACLHVK
uniref:Uncharacterized protein n=1 Tax=Cacopsylla melanoneura TaxID=428564 RepID=A0A8D8QXR7_9HEMI